MTGAHHIASVIAIAREKQVTVDAASLAFYAFNSFVALAVLVYATFSVLGTGTVLPGLLQALTGVGAVEFQRLFEQVGGGTAGRRRAIVLAVAIAVWSSLRLFRAVESVFVEVYEIRKERSVLEHLVDSVLVLVVVTVTIAVLASVGTLFLFRTTGWLWSVLGPFVMWLALVVLFFPMYYTFSDEDASGREILPGTAFAAAGWTISAIVLRVYLGMSESVDLYGVVGALLLVLTWLYVVGLSILLGVISNAHLAGRIDADQEWYLFDR